MRSITTAPLRSTLLGDTNSAAPAARCLGVLPAHSQAPVVPQTTVVPAEDAGANVVEEGEGWSEEGGLNENSNAKNGQR